MPASCGKKSGGSSFSGWSPGLEVREPGSSPSLPQVHPMKKICIFSSLDSNFPINEGGE